MIATIIVIVIFAILLAMASYIVVDSISFGEYGWTFVGGILLLMVIVGVFATFSDVESQSTNNLLTEEITYNYCPTCGQLIEVESE